MAFFAFFDLFWDPENPFFSEKKGQNRVFLPTNRPPPQIKMVNSQKSKSPTFDREIMRENRVWYRNHARGGSKIDQKRVIFRVFSRKKVKKRSKNTPFLDLSRKPPYYLPTYPPALEGPQAIFPKCPFFDISAPPPPKRSYYSPHENK